MGTVYRPSDEIEVPETVEQQVTAFRQKVLCG
jgi:hypothetical protein